MEVIDDPEGEKEDPLSIPPQGVESAAQAASRMALRGKLRSAFFALNGTLIPLQGD